MGLVSRKLLTNGFKLFDLLLMVLGLAVAARPFSRKVGAMTFADMMAMRIRIGHLLLLFGFLVIWHFIFKFFRLYGSKRLSSRWNELQDVLKATTLGSLCIA